MFMVKQLQFLVRSFSLKKKKKVTEQHNVYMKFMFEFQLNMEIHHKYIQCFVSNFLLLVENYELCKSEKLSYYVIKISEIMDLC
jgi:hypothetical protein